MNQQPNCLLGQVSEAVRELTSVQRARPHDTFPLRTLSRALLAAARSNVASHFAAVRDAAAADFHSVLRLLALADTAGQLKEVRNFRYAYQQLVLPHLAAQLGEAVILDSAGLTNIDRAELLVELGRLSEAELAYSTLMTNESDNTHIAAQWSRIRDERRSDLERSELIHAFGSRDSASHWALQKPSTFTAVERRNAAKLTYKEFYENFTLARRPVILTGLDLYEGWDWDFIAQTCGEALVHLRAPLRSNRSVSWGGLRLLPQDLRLADFIKKVRQNQPAGPDDGFVFDLGLANEKFGCPKLLEHFRLPRFFSNDVLKRLPSSQQRLDPFRQSPGLFVQPLHSASSLHVDALDSHFMQVLLEGRKRWTFYALEPERQRLLLARRLAFQVKENGPNVARETRWFELIGPDGDASTEKLLRAAEPYRVEVTLEKGEMLFVPGGVPHQVTQLAPSLAIALNYIDQANLGTAIDRLEWLANFTENSEKRAGLLRLLAEPPPHSMEPTDKL